MRITEQEIDGYCWCTFSPAKGVLCDPDPNQDGQQVQHPVQLVEQTVEFTFRDGWSKDTGDPFDAAIAEQVQNSVQHYRLADEAEVPCPRCGHARSCSPQLRPVYDSVSGQPQDELLRRLRREEREASVLARQSTDRQTDELVRANELKLREVEAMEEANALRRAELERRVNGGDEGERRPQEDEVAPRPRRKATT